MSTSKEYSQDSIPLVEIKENIATEHDGKETTVFYQAAVHPVSVLYRVLFSLAAIVVGIDNVTIKQLILPAQMALIDPTNKIAAFTLIASVGALAGVISSPLIGALSDRTTSRWGRRRPWMIMSMLGISAGLVIMGVSTAVWEVLIGEIIVQFSADGLLAVCTAIIPDQVPQKQRYIVSALAGMAPLVGGGVGIALISRFTNVLTHPGQGYFITAIVSVLFVLSFLLVFREQPLPRELVKPFHFSELLTDFGIDLKKYPDVAFVWLSRFFAFFGYQTLITYLLYYLQDVMHLTRADQGVASFTLSSIGALLVAAIVSGILAGRTERLKIFVVCGALVMSIALFCIAFIPVWSVLLLAGVLLGIGFGVYLAVDQSVAVKVLPRADARGKDLGLINTAIFIPLIISPLLGGAIISSTHNYSILFSVTAVLFILAAVSILPVKTVK